MFTNALACFRLVAFLEGCSYLLFAITMPLKYKLGIPQPNYVIGMIHGLLFVSYVILLIKVAVEYKWTFKKTALAFIAAWIPFGTFIANKKLYPATVA